MKNIELAQNFGQKLANSLIFALLLCFVLELAVAWGIVEKTWWEKSWEFVTGGTIGLLTGIAFFVGFGAIGWVCGPLNGGVYLVGLALGGAVGGLGLGALANIIRHPESYEFSWHVIVPTLLVGALLARIVSDFLARRVALLAKKAHRSLMSERSEAQRAAN